MKAYGMRIEDLQGQRIGRYDVGGVLGRGGMAAVYRALDTVLRREIALKVLYPHFLSDQEQIARFQREAVVAASLDHPNIVQIYDVGNEQGFSYIAMQLLPGRTLGDLLRERGSLPLAELAPIIDQVASALDYAHARGIIHRDIKPANLLIDNDGRAVLTDFGIAKLLDTPGLTSTSVIVGTPDYMAPEQISGQAVDGRADIYALGVLVFRALSGHRPFEGGTDQVLLGHLHGNVPSVLASTPGLPSGIDPIIQRAMARRPADRYQTASEFAADLRAIAGLPPAHVQRRGPTAPLQTAMSDPAPTLRSTPVTVDQTPVALLGGTIPVAPLQQAPRRNRLIGLILVALLLAAGGGFVLARSLNADTSGGIGLVPTAPATEAPAPTIAPAIAVPAPTNLPAATNEPSVVPTVAPTKLPIRPTAQPTRAPVAQPSAIPTAVAPTAVPPTISLPATTAPTAVPLTLLGVFKPIYDADAKLRERLGAITEAAPNQAGAEQPFEVGGMLWSGQPDDTIYVLLNTKDWFKYPKNLQQGQDTPPPPATPAAGRFVPISGFGRVWSTHSELQVALGLATARETAIPFAYQRFQGGEMLYSASGFGTGKTIYVLYNDSRKFEEFALSGSQQ